MPDESIDYQTLCEGLQHENERLRMSILKLHTHASSFNWQEIRSFVQENYAVLLLALFALYYAGSLAVDVYTALRGPRT